MPSKWSNTGAKRAREARAALGHSWEGPLDDVLRLVEDEGGTPVLILAMDDGIAGAYLAQTETPLILVNGSQATARQRFTLAHEFGHHRMSHETVVDKPAAISGYDHNPDEVAANAFAAEFLMPREAVRGWAGENIDGPVCLDHVIGLAYAFGTSAQAARYALATAGVLADRKRCDQLDAEINDELHVDLAQRLRLEPIEDEISRSQARLPRIPRALKDTALGDLLAGELDVDGFAARMGRDREAAEAMLDRLGLSQALPAAAF